MYRAILVPLDGSALGERALPFAAALAQRMGARLHLASVVSVKPPADLSPALVELAELVEVERVEAYLAPLAADLQQRGLATTTAVRTGDVVAQLIADVARSGSDLIVIATGDKTALGRSGFGRVAEGLLLGLTTPVVMVRPWHTDAALRHLMAPEARILVPLDGSPTAELILPVAVAFAAALRAELDLLAVVAPASAAVAPAAEGAYLQRLVGRLAVGGQRVRYEVRAGKPVEEIVGAARSRGIALVAMATHGQSGHGGTVLGSVANAVVWTGIVPTVLVGPGPDVAPEAPPDGEVTRAHGLAAAKQQVFGRG